MAIFPHQQILEYFIIIYIILCFLFSFGLLRPLHSLFYEYYVAHTNLIFVAMSKFFQAHSHLSILSADCFYVDIIYDTKKKTKQNFSFHLNLTFTWIR